MPNKEKSWRRTTQSVRVGNAIDRETGAVHRPIHMSNSYRSLSFLAGASEGEPSFGYARDGHANQYYLEQRLAALEGGEACLVVGSGTAANNVVFFTLLSSGDHIVCANPCYYSVHRFLKDHLARRFGVGLTFVNATDLDSVRSAMQPNTKIIHVETPANPITRIVDIQAVSEVAKEAGALLTVDSTWASPFVQQPLRLGADLVMHSLTKYINGHGDALGGAVIGQRELVERLRVEGMVRLGQTISPFNAWLIMRGMTTLPARMRQHCDSAMQIAQYLENHPAVDFVRYPGLPSHPQHDVACQQMQGFSGMLNLRLKSGNEGHLRLINSLELVLPAVSLGHDESLILHHPLTEDDAWYEILKKTTDDVGPGFLRLSVGLEDPDDLIEDFEQALEGISSS